MVFAVQDLARPRLSFNLRSESIGSVPMSDIYVAEAEVCGKPMRECVANVARAIQCSVRENWALGRDKYSVCKCRFDPEKLLSLYDQVKHAETLECVSGLGAGYRGFLMSSVSYSPYSCGLLVVQFRLPDPNQDAHVNVSLHISWMATEETMTDRIRGHMEYAWQQENPERSRGQTVPDQDDSAYDDWWAQWGMASWAEDDSPNDEKMVWPQNKPLFINVLNHVLSAVPVRRLEIDEALYEPSVALRRDAIDIVRRKSSDSSDD